MYRVFFICLIFILTSIGAHAHDHPKPGEARYIANEAILVHSGETKILFDPLPLTGFGVYPDVPEKDRDAMMAGTAPYDGIDAVFISHAHRDHFSAEAMNDYLAAQTEIILIAPQQAKVMMRAADNWNGDFAGRITAIDLAFKDAPFSIAFDDLTASAVRIPHSGWPGRADVQNLVYRVSLNDGVTVAHMGDADLGPTHYIPYEKYWQSKVTDMAFPPYWFHLAPIGPQILEFMNVDESVGIHVPIKVPADLKASGADFFSVSGETRPIGKAAMSSCQPKEFEAQNFTVCEFSASEDIRLFWGEGTEPFMRFEALDNHVKASGKELTFAMNGGMYHSDRRPVGYYLENGETRQSLMTKSSNDNFGMLPNGVFHLSPGRAGVTETKAFATKDMDITYASQSGPMLVINGSLHPKFRKNSTSRKRRNGVGVSHDGQTVYFAISDAPVNFHTFGRLFQEELGTPNALYLDGVISRLYDKPSGRHDMGLPMGPIIGVVR